MLKLLRELLWPQPIAMIPLREPEPARLPPIYTITLPGGEKLRVLRKDIFDKAIRRL